MAGMVRYVAERLGKSRYGRHGGLWHARDRFGVVWRAWLGVHSNGSAGR
nr:MAG TPA: hypothetical protein [Caudoviricetes sp.]